MTSHPLSLLPSPLTAIANPLTTTASATTTSFSPPLLRPCFRALHCCTVLTAYTKCATQPFQQLFALRLASLRLPALPTSRSAITFGAADLQQQPSAEFIFFQDTAIRSPNTSLSRQFSKSHLDADPRHALDVLIQHQNSSRVALRPPVSSALETSSTLCRLPVDQHAAGAESRMHFR